MEELRTSEVLEREILDDARKKADKLLKNAEKEIRALEGEWKLKRETAFQELESQYAVRRAETRREIESTLPLEMKRQELKYYDETLRSVLEEYFSSLSEERILRFVKDLLMKVSTVFKGKSVVLFYGGVSKERAEKVLTESCACRIARAAEKKKIRGLIVELEDGSVHYTATLGELEIILLDEKREELFTMLFGANG